MNKILVGGYIVGAVQTNVYYLHREGSKECVVVDPADMGEAIGKALADQDLQVGAILLTHGHYDHIWGVADLVAYSKAPVIACEMERDFLLDPMENHSGLHNRPCTVTADRYVRDGEQFTLLGDMEFTCLWTPGHTHGSCCYYIAGQDADNGTGAAPILLSGDTLFYESVGRTDLPTGSMSELVRSVREKLFALPDDTIVYPGHGSATTIEHEKEANYYI